MTTTITCPECELEFDEEIRLNSKDGAEAILQYYTGHCSLGDAVKFQEKIEEILAKDFGVSIGKM